MFHNLLHNNSLFYLHHTWLIHILTFLKELYTAIIWFRKLKVNHTHQDIEVQVNTVFHYTTAHIKIGFPQSWSVPKKLI